MNSPHDDVLDQYEQMWQNSEHPPMLGQFFAACRFSLNDRPDLLADLVAIDLEYRWRTSSGDQSLRATEAVLGTATDKDETIIDTIGERPTVERYAREWPELQASARLSVDLPAEEFRVRHRWGDRPDIESFLRRFNGDQRLRSELLAVLDELQRDQVGVGETKHSADENSHPIVGESFGRYRLIRQLGKGGMGQVYLAQDTQLERRVALKIPSLGGSDVVKKRFVNEAKAAAVLHHPNICPVFDSGEIDGQPFLTMAFLEGTTLREFWRHHDKPSDEEIATHFATIAEAMQTAHDAGIVHRDLKPSNVMIDRKGNPVVMDFGLAFRGGAADERLTQTGDAFGSPAYMSPEQIEGDHASVGPASDIYSLGVMLYEALTGSLPFTGTASSIAVRIARDVPQRPSTLCQDCHVDLEQLCLRMLQKDPAMRPASMSEVAIALREFAQQHRIVQPARPTKSSAQLADRRPPMTYVATLIGLAVIGFFAAALVIKVQTNQGEVVIKSFDPNIEVLVKRNGTLVDEITLDNDPVSTKVRTGEISIEVKGVEPDGVRITNGKFELSKNDRIVVEILPASSAVDDQRIGDVAASASGKIVVNDSRPSLFDQLDRKQITPYQLKVAGGGDPANAPRELVAVLGDSRLQHEQHAAVDVRFTSDGNILVSGGNDGNIRFWDVGSGELLQEIVVSHASCRIIQIAVSPNGERIAALFDTGTHCALAIHDIASGVQGARFEDVSGDLAGMDWADDQHVICLESGQEEKLSIRNVSTGDTLRSFATPPRNFTLMSLSPDRKQLAIAMRFPTDDSARAAVFSVETGDRLHERFHDSIANQQISSISWHPAANTVEMTTANPVSWNLDDGSVEVYEKLHAPNGVAWAPDGQLLAMAAADGVRLWTPDRRTQTQHLSSFVGPMSKTLRFSPDGEYLAAGSHNGAVLLWNVSTGKLVDGFDGHSSAVTAVAVSSDGKHIASSSLDRTVRIWDPATGKEKHLHTGTGGAYSDFYDVAISPDSSLVAAGGRATGALKVWEVASNELRFELPLANNQEGTQVKLAADSKSVMLATNHPPTLSIYSIGNPVPTFQPDLEEAHLWSADYHSRKNLLVAACGDEVLFWRVGTSEPVQQLQVDGPVWSVQFSLDGSSLLVAGQGIRPRLYDLLVLLDDSVGESYRELSTHDQGSTLGANFDHSGNRIATLDATRRLSLWDAKTLRELHHIRLPKETSLHYTHYQRQLAFAPDNRHILVANNNGTIYVLRLSN